MFSARELRHFGCLDCSYCIHCGDKKSCHRHDKYCDFEPHCWNAYIAVVVHNLKLCTTKNTKEHKIVRKNKHKPQNGTFDDAFISDSFYVQLVNDSLYLIRHNQCAFVFSLYHIVDILRYEPDISVTYLPDANTFCIWLDRKS